MGLFDKFKQGLKKTAQLLKTDVRDLFKKEGRLVDDAIVDVENTIRHLKLGLPPLEAARESAREIAMPVLMATVTTVVVFLPYLSSACPICSTVI